MEEEKKMGVFSLTALVTGNMIGAGIFLLPSAMALLGSLSLFSWILTFLGSLSIAFIFSRMSRLVPKTGGPYAYTQAGLGDALGFQAAYSYWINAWVGNAAIVLAGIGYLSVFFPALSHPVVACFVAIAFVWLFTFINLKGVHVAGIVTLITTIVKLIPILLVAFLGWFFFHPEYVTLSANVTQAPHLSTFDVIMQGIPLTLWCFIGVESATVPAGSVHNPSRTIPIATVLGLLIAAVAYIGSSVAITGMIPNEILQKSIYPFADAAQIIMGDWGKWLVAVGAAVSCLGCLNGWILIQGQIPMAAADDHLFLKIFGRRNKNGVPAQGLFITAILITILLLLTISPDLVQQYKMMILIATFAVLIVYLYTPIAELILYMRGGHHYTKTAVGIAIVGILYSLGAIWGAGLETLAYGSFLFFVLSIPLYLFVIKKSS